MTKACSRCGQEQALDNFNRDKRRRDGKRPECKACHRGEAGKWRERNLERASANWSRWREENPLRYMLWRAKAHARQAGRECTITEDDIVVPAVCPVFGVKLKLPGEAGRHDPHSASIDRIDSSRGYVPGNIVVVSARANWIKRDATVDELRAVTKFYEELTNAKPA